MAARDRCDGRPGGLRDGRGAWAHRGHPGLVSRMPSKGTQPHVVTALATRKPATPLPFTLWPLSPVNVYSR
jgi:hypothetical protein